MAIQLNLEFEFALVLTYLDWKTPKYELLSYRKLKPHESQVRPQQSFCNRDILFNFFPTRQHTHKSYSETYSNPTMCSNIFLKEHSHFFTIVFSKDSPLIGLPSQRGFQLRGRSQTTFTRFVFF